MDHCLLVTECCSLSLSLSLSYLSIPCFPVEKPEEEGEGKDFQNQFPGEQRGGLYWVSHIAISIYRPRPFSALLKTLSFHSAIAFFFSSDADISVYNWKFPDDNAPVRRTSSNSAEGRFPSIRAYVGSNLLFERATRVRLRGNKGRTFREEEHGKRAKSSFPFSQAWQHATTSYLLPLRVVRLTWRRRVWPISTLNFHKLGPVPLAHT